MAIGEAENRIGAESIRSGAAAASINNSQLYSAARQRNGSLLYGGMKAIEICRRHLALMALISWLSRNRRGISGVMKAS